MRHVSCLFQIPLPWISCWSLYDDRFKKKAFCVDFVVPDHDRAAYTACPNEFSHCVQRVSLITHHVMYSEVRSQIRAYVFLKSVAAFNISEAFDPDLNPLTFDR